MQRFPLVAKIYVWAVILAGVPAFVCAYHLGVDLTQWRVLLALCGICAIAVFWNIPLFTSKSGENSSRMSLAFVPTFFTLLCFGPFAGMISVVAGYIATSLSPKRGHYFQILFNVSAVAVSVLAAGMILRQADLALPGGVMASPHPVGSADHWKMLGDKVPYIFLASLAYYLINTVSIATAIALTTGANPLQIWRAHFLWTGPGYFAGASCATIIYALGIGENLRASPDRWGVILAVAAPILFLTYYSYKIYMDKVQANERHIQALERSKEELQQLYLSTVESLALAIEAKDQYTREHILRVQKTAVAIAEAMGLSGDELRGIHTGALLHDIGKLGIPEHILAKPGKLTPDEYEKIKAHPAIGSMILEPVRFPWPVLPAVRSHHERWDGKGYPDGLKGEQIPLAGRIMAVADVYDALTSDRSYREGWAHEKACSYICENAGTHFDPVVVGAFLDVMQHNALLHNNARSPKERAVDTAHDARGEVVEGIKRASFEYISLYEISQTVSVTLNLKETLSLLANKINNIFGGTACVLLLGDDDTLRAEMAVGANEPFFRGAQARRGEGMTGTVALRGEGRLDPYDRGDLLLASAHTPWTNLEAALIAPLFADNKVIGTVNLYHERADGFDSEDLRVLLAVSAQAGRAIKNATLFEKTRESALTDALTGLHNARYLALFLQQELHRAGADERPLSVLVMDLDNFKPINDTFGHPRGDEVLRDLARVFKTSLRSGDLIARYAGDEFVAVLPDAGPAEAAVVAEKLRAAVAAYDPRVSGNDLGGIRVGISIGSASFPEDVADAATLIACADAAMYHDKSLRKSQRPRPTDPSGGGGGPVPKLRLVA